MSLVRGHRRVLVCEERGMEFVRSGSGGRRIYEYRDACVLAGNCICT